MTAILPSITEAEAIALTGNEDVPRLLEYLYRRHLFVDRRRGEPTIYHYHALFREFLLEQGRRRLTADTRRELVARAAGLLEARGEAVAALALYRDADDWAAMTRLIKAHALEWARHGRAQALSDWIEALPPALRERRSLARLLVRPRLDLPATRARRARRWSARTTAFCAAGDVRGQVLALHTIVIGHYYEWANFTPLDRWLPEFERLLARRPRAPRSIAAERAARAVGVADRAAVPPARASGPRAAAPAGSTSSSIGEPDVNVRMMAASMLFNYLNWYTKGDAADGLVARIEPLLARPDVTPLMQVWWRTHLRSGTTSTGATTQAPAVTAEARAIAERYGLDAYLFEIDHAEASAT